MRMLNSNRKGSYKKMVLGLVGGHLLSMIISLVVSSLLGRFENSYITIAMYLICLFFGLFFSYHEGWIAGASDKLYISSNKISFTPWKGVKAGAMASVLNFVIALLAFLSCITPLGAIKVMGQELFELIYRIWFWAFCWMFPLVDKILILHFIPIIAMPAACGIGYVLGVKHFHLSEYVLYKKDNK